MVDIDGVNPLIDARKKIEAQIQIYLDKVAILRKRHDALSMAIDVLRSSDSELEGITVKSATTRRTPVDHEAIEKVVLAVLESGNGAAMYANRIYKAVAEAGYQVSDGTVRNVMMSCPRITRIGERNETRYKLVTSEKVV